MTAVKATIVGLWTVVITYEVNGNGIGTKQNESIASALSSLKPSF